MKDGSILSILQAGGDLPLEDLHHKALQIKENPQKIVDEAKEYNFDPNKYKQIVTLLANSQYQRLPSQIPGLYKAGVIDLSRDFRANNLANLVSLYPRYKDHMDMERLILANPSNEDKAKTTFVHEMFANNCPREAILDYFQKLNKLANSNPQLIDNYLALSNSEGKSIRQIIEEKSLSESYLGILDEIKNSCRTLYGNREHGNAPNIDTHTESVHGSVDQSFTRLALVYDPNLVTEDVSERSVAVTRNAEWNSKIQTDFEELEQDLRAIVANDKSVDEFIEPTLAKGEDKELTKEKFKFKASAALRLVEGLKAGSYGNHYTVMANEKVSCGLTPKEIVAIGYASLKNKDLWNNPEQEKLHFMQFLENLYIAKRGYNIDRGEGNGVVDDNKCTGGLVNQVAYGLVDHKLVEVKVITTETMAPVLGKTLADRLLNIASSPENISLARNWLTTSTLNESLGKLIITKLQNDPEFSQEFSQTEIQNIGTRVLNKLGQSELGYLRQELQTRLPEKFPENMVLSDSLSDKDRVNSFAFEEGKGYAPYLEHLYHLDPNRFNETLQSILPQGDSLDSDDSRKNNLILSLLLASQDEALVNATKEMLQANLIVWNQAEKDQYLVLMAASDHIHLLDPLITAGANVNAEDQRIGHGYMTALHHAAKNGKLDTIAKLVSAGADINAKDLYGHTALHDTILYYDKMDTIEKLIELRSDVNAQDNDGDTALHIAAKNGKIDVIAKLIDAGANVNAKGNDGKTALHIAAKNGKIDVIAKLIDAGANVNAKNKHGDTALHIAAANGKIDVIAKLIEWGADVNAQDNDGDTALHIAATYGKIDVIAKLIELGADVNAKDNDGNTAIHVAGGLSFSTFSPLSNLKDIVNTITKLGELGADVNVKNKFGKTALYIALENDKVDALTNLIKLGADVNDINKYGETALYVAVRNGQFDAIAKLIELGADVNAKNNDDGKTALHIAAKNDKIDAIAQAIKQKSSDIPKVVTNLIKQASGYIQDDHTAWKLVESIVSKIDSSERIEMVGKMLEGIDNTSRRDRLLSFIPEDERNMARALSSPTLWEAVRETASLMHGNSSEDVPKRASDVAKPKHSDNRIRGH